MRCAHLFSIFRTGWCRGTHTLVTRTHGCKKRTGVHAYARMVRALHSRSMRPRAGVAMVEE